MTRHIRQAKAFGRHANLYFHRNFNITQERLIENRNLISDDVEISTIFNEIFNRINDSLNIPSWHSVYEQN